jgi:hypothetical protein
MMKKITVPLARCICLVAGCTALLPGTVFGQEQSALGSRAGPVTGHAQEFDWVEHTRSTLGELKAKLTLDPGQMPAWDTWSNGVVKDAHRQISPQSARPDDTLGVADSYSDETTPAQMARGIEHLRAHTAWMQDHLVELEAAQARTQAFYDALDAKQKTIFDLYWHEIRHRVSGHDGDWPMRGKMHEGAAMGAMTEPQEHDDRGSSMRQHADPMTGY